MRHRARKSRLPTLVVAGALALVLSGCSGSDEPVATSESGSSRAASEPASAPASTMTLTSPAFSEGDTVPEEFTCNGANTSPALSVGGVPDSAASLVIVMDDPDAPNGTFDHWVVYDAPVIDEIAAGTEPGVQGTNSFGVTGYRGPCPPPGGDHRYVFRVLALDTELGLPMGESKDAVLTAAEGKTVAEASLTGLYGTLAGAHE